MVSGARRGDRHRLVRWCALDSGGGAGMQEAFLQDFHRPSRLWMVQLPRPCEAFDGLRQDAHQRGPSGLLPQRLGARRPHWHYPGKRSVGRAAAMTRRSRASLTGPGPEISRRPGRCVGRRCASSSGLGRCYLPQDRPRLSSRTSAWAEALHRQHPAPDHPAGAGRDRRRHGGRSRPPCPAPEHPPAGSPPG